MTKSICTFCQTSIKNESEAFTCPSCNSPYHQDCWAENRGCSVYGCGEKINEYDEQSSLREAIINIEYLINRNQYSEAIFEAKQYLKIDRKSAELKNLYNKAVSLINNKINLMSSGDEAFGKKDYKAAEIYYNNVLKYTDEVEANFINARLEIAKEKIPEQKRKKMYQNILIIAVIVVILSALGYLGYHTFILKEDKEYAELVKSDKPQDLRAMELMISKYESFLRNYSDSKNKEGAINKINQYSYQIASIFYKDDWKLALKYYNKIYKSLDNKDAQRVYNNIYNVAYKEYQLKISNAKRLNSSSKFSESLNELSNAMLIISFFPDSKMGKEKQIIEANISLLNKKLSSIVKSNDIEREIREQSKVLSDLRPSVSNKLSVLIAARLGKLIEPNIYVGREVGTENIIAIKSNNVNYKIGQIVNLECVMDDKLYLSDENNIETSVPLYIPYFEIEDSGPANLSLSEREAIYERLKNLKIQKAKIDSLLKHTLL